APREAPPRATLDRVDELKISVRAGAAADWDFGDLEDFREGYRLRRLRLSLPEPSSSALRRVGRRSTEAM
ncbi:MAG: hypothetical protein AB1758_25085, partial [Candidatus Eremiobacterota bacterium]